MDIHYLDEEEMRQFDEDDSDLGDADDFVMEGIYNYFNYFDELFF